MKSLTLCLVLSVQLILVVEASAQTTIATNTTLVVSGKSLSERLYRFSVPAGLNSVLEVSTSGGSGDCDLYLRKGAVPTLTSSLKSAKPSSTKESIQVGDGVGGEWYLLVRGGTTSYANVSLAVTLPGRRWDFNESGSWWTPPSGWGDASQDILSTPAKPHGYGLVDGALVFGTRANTGDRFKVVTKSSYRLGTISYRIWIPRIDGQDAGTGGTIGAFLYSSGTGPVSWLKRPEIDIEIGWGKTQDRSRFGVRNGQLLAYFIVQPCGLEAGKVLGVPVDPDNWYTFAITTTATSSGTLDVCWQYAKAGNALSKCSSTTSYQTKYPASTEFWIFASLENNGWSAATGESFPKKARQTKFDWIAYRP